MKQYNMGPNGGILTALNLFATKFADVIGLCEARRNEVRERSKQSSLHMYLLKVIVTLLGSPRPRSEYTQPSTFGKPMLSMMITEKIDSHCGIVHASFSLVTVSHVPCPAA